MPTNLLPAIDDANWDYINLTIVVGGAPDGSNAFRFDAWTEGPFVDAQFNLKNQLTLDITKPFCLLLYIDTSHYVFSTEDNFLGFTLYSGGLTTGVPFTLVEPDNGVIIFGSGPGLLVADQPFYKGNVCGPKTGTVGWYSVPIYPQQSPCGVGGDMYDTPGYETSNPDTGYLLISNVTLYQAADCSGTTGCSLNCNAIALELNTSCFG
jgi:hypothetical protein